MFTRVLLILLVIVFVLDQCIIGLQVGHQLRFGTKTLLVPILIAYYAFSTNKINKLFLAGLVMSFFGDLFLMFKGGFIAGLSSFLLAHIFYILTFKQFFQHKNLALIPLILIFVGSLIGFLYPHLGGMKIPVILYALTIGLMLYIALGTKQTWLIVGAILFVLSDSILAINLFYKQSLLGGMSVMLTYVIAQYCLVVGMVKRG
ncbi:lysoplasmalogenase [Sphingobacterium bovistauri]|uniref:lysoplasmalogenase n=1 Tax=Sphingobacterium bovistauri TaxID=2781959 RepID=UPI001CE1C061|nr:lysoplasmalogenase [Sphingobacterium bovistauri]